MAIELPYSILHPQRGETAAKVAGRRWGYLKEQVLHHLRASGYNVKSLGGQQYSLTKDGKTHTAVVKSASDRWLNGSSAAAAGVDMVYVATFWPRFKDPIAPEPKKFQIAKIDAKAYVDMVRKVEAKPGSGQVYIPLSEHEYNQTNVGCSAGYLLEHGRIIFEDDIDWYNEGFGVRPAPQPEPEPQLPAVSPVSASLPMSLSSVMAALKSEVEKQVNGFYGADLVEDVKISVKLKPLEA